MLTKEMLQTLIDSGDPEAIKLAQTILTDAFYSFEPRPDKPEIFDEQISYINSTHEGINCVIAGNGSGKSYCAAYKCAKFLRETPPPVDLAKYFFVSQNVRMMGILWQEKLSKFIPKDMIEDITWYSLASQHPKSIILKPHKNGNRWNLLFSSYEQGRKSFQATSQGCGYLLDEQCTDFGIIEELDTRCREFKFPGSKNYVLTPLMPDEKLEQRFNMPQEYPYWKFFRMNAECNETLADMGWLENCPEDMRETRRIGAFLNFEGLVFKELNPNKHIIEPFTNFPVGTEFIRIIDPGWSHKTGVLLLAKHNDNVWVVKEWSATNMLIADKAKNIFQLMPGNFTNIVDPAAAQERAELSRHGLPSIPIHKDVPLSIEKIKTRLTKNTLFIFNTCKELITELKNYQWRPDSGKGDMPKDRPIKRGDDLIDCLRMGITHFDRNADLSPWKQALPNIPQSKWKL